MRQAIGNALFEMRGGSFFSVSCETNLNRILQCMFLTVFGALRPTYLQYYVAFLSFFCCACVFVCDGTRNVAHCGLRMTSSNSELLILGFGGSDFG
jgi:hypothetical protein